jgi:pimeloyl-ACP methyl ester carboxylesterase
MRDLARWVRDTCLRVKAEHVTLIGHSMGGNLAAQTALDYPDLVKRLVLIDAALNTDALPVHSRLALSNVTGMAALRLMRLASWPAAYAGRSIAAQHDGGHWKPMARRIHLYTQTSSDDALYVQLRALRDNPIRASDLAKLTVPLLLVHGRYDHMVPIAHARAIARQLPHARLRVFDAARHCPMDTDPAGFAEALREFLRDGSI